MLGCGRRGGKCVRVEEGGERGEVWERCEKVCWGVGEGLGSLLGWGDDVGK